MFDPEERAARLRKLADLPSGHSEEDRQPGARFYIAPDHVGSPHQIADASGAVVWLWNHDPFGNGDPTGTFAKPGFQ